MGQWAAGRWQNHACRETTPSAAPCAPFGTNAMGGGFDRAALFFHLGAAVSPARLRLAQQLTLRLVRMQAPRPFAALT